MVTVSDKYLRKEEDQVRLEREMRERERKKRLDAGGKDFITSRSLMTICSLKLQQVYLHIFC